MNSNAARKQMQELEKELDILKRKKEQIQAQWNQIEQEKQFSHVQVQPTDFIMHSQQIPQGPYMQNAPYQNPGYRQKSNRKRNNQERFSNKWRAQHEAGSKKKKFYIQSPNEKKKEDYVLHEDCEPSVKLVGRLELGLGHILKDMRTHFPEPPYDYMFLNTESVKAIKLEVRERIRKTMVGKNVVGLDFLIQTYRAAYPLEGDRELLDRVKAKIDQQLEASSAQTADLLIVKNFIGKKLEQILDEIFTKMTDMCKDSELGAGEFRKRLTEKNEEENEKNEEKIEENNGNDDAGAVEETSEAPSKPNYDVTKEQFTELLRSSPMDERKLIKFIRTQLNTLLPSYKSYIKKILYEDADFVKFVMQGKSNKNQRDLVTHYIRILGRPVLPGKKAINDFLQQFNPLHIKRHKTIPNLLFVGVGTDEDLDGILEKHNIQIEDTQLSIRSSARNPQSGENTTNDNGELDNATEGTAEFLNDDNVNDFCSDMELDAEEDNYKEDE